VYTRCPDAAIQQLPDAIWFFEIVPTCFPPKQQILPLTHSSHTHTHPSTSASLSPPSAVVPARGKELVKTDLSIAIPKVGLCKCVCAKLHKLTAIQHRDKLKYKLNPVDP
jgi:hypothetical protein